MSEILRKRLAGREEGFTLIELLVVIVILGILLAIAVPSYMGFRERAEQKAAAANVRAALPAVEAYYGDHGDYLFNEDQEGNASGVGDIETLRLIDQNIELTAATPGDATYCISSQVGDSIASLTGPGGDIDEDAAANCA